MPAPVGVDVAERDHGALGQEAFDDARPESGGPTCDDRDLARQFVAHVGAVNSLNRTPVKRLT